MPWIPLEVESRHQYGSLREVAERAKFLLDNDCDAPLMERVLDGDGISTQRLPVALRRRGDEEVLAEAWRQDRILLTHDRGFLDERRHPVESNPGVIVMPGGSGDVLKHLSTIRLLLRLVREYRPLFRHTYIDIQHGGRIVIKGQNATTGSAIEPWWLRFDDNGNPEMWVDE
jgi:predicted nuclease of predicted toxin-antitoxin system